MKQVVKEIHKRNIESSSKHNELPEFYLTDELLQDLQDFCDVFNPYEELSLENKLRLQEYGINDHDNPFEVTNKLLLLLENNIQFREK